MIALSSASELLAAVLQAHRVAVMAYVLPPGRVEKALADAARRGARVVVRLEGQPYGDPDGTLLALNERAIAALRAAGADARLVHAAGTNDAPVHAKFVVADDTLFLDDRNFADGSAQTILRDDVPGDVRAAADAVNGRGDPATPTFAMRKRDALASEAILLSGAQSGSDVCVSSESLGRGNAVYDAIDALARRGVHVRVLVNERIAGENTHDADALERLRSDGVDVRLSDGAEKFALVAEGAWLGSTNASADFTYPDQLDWGMRTDVALITSALRARFEESWRGARLFQAEEGTRVRVGTGDDVG